jgi:eukaryotic-like serine/threonine-protein kinase
MLAMSSPDSAESRDFLQARLVVFARMMVVLFGIVVVSSYLSCELLPHITPPGLRRANWIAAEGTTGLGVLWLLARWRPYPLWVLRAADSVIMITAGCELGIGAYLAANAPIHLFAPFTLGILLLFARVFTVPSTAARTAWLSTAFMAPLSAGNIASMWPHRALLGMPYGAFAIGGTALAALTVALATVGSSVIFGLRREVRAAQRFGQYTLDRKLGEGGMGVVYLAQHALLRRPTAIKLLPPDKAGAHDVARFEREVQLTSQLTHPNTIAIFDYGRSVDGIFYYVMEYLDGVDLETLVARSGPVPVGRAVRILGQICGALAEAHARGVVHRDIKPANVILCRRGHAPDFVKVVDFGLVKELHRGEDAQVTAAGTIAGTPAYLAPEAIRDPEQAGTLADIYALGALGYFLVTGSMVFDGKNVLEICGQHLHATPAAPSTRAPGIPADLDRLVLACLAKAPADRPQSARAVAEALEAIAAPDWSDEEALAWWSTFDSERTAESAPHATLAMADTVAFVPARP